MWLLQVLFAAVIGYLLGAIPVGYLVAKAWGVDALKTESGRTGATNVWRATNSTTPLVLTVAGDVLKAVVAVLVGRYLFHSELAAAMAGAGAVLGHNWSVFLGWRGGAGGIVSGSALIALSPIVGAVVAVVALSALYISHYASVGTLIAADGGLVALVLVVVAMPSPGTLSHVVLGMVSAVAVTIALRPNLKRLVQGTERRITLW